jgi:hypothetical protein
MGYLILVDVIQAIHLNANSEFRSTELIIKLPMSDHDFGDVYSKFLVEISLPSDVTECEDAVLILLALFSDILATQKVFSNLNLQPPQISKSDTDTDRILSHFVPFSASSESRRMLSQLDGALDRWSDRFRGSMPEEVLALFHFSKICSIWPSVLLLPRYSGYTSMTPTATSTTLSTYPRAAPPDEALRHAWLVLDNVNMRSQQDSFACPMWLPVVTYFSALVVWWSLQPTTAPMNSIGSVKVLSMFKAELEQMPWPCCKAMVKNLEELMCYR